MDPREVDSIITRLGQHQEMLDQLQAAWTEARIRKEVAGKLQLSDDRKVSDLITNCRLGMCNLYDAIREPLQRAIRDPLVKAGITVQGGLPVAGDSSTPSTSSEKKDSGPDAQESTETKESHPKISDQPSTSGVKEGELNLRPMTGKSEIRTNIVEISPFWQVYQTRWEKLNTRQGLNPSYCRVDAKGKYPRVWMLPGAKPHEVREWYEFGALASVYTVAPGFEEIRGLPRWIQEDVYKSWTHNESLKRGDAIELYFFSAAPEPTGKGQHEAFHFIKMRRPDIKALERITEKEGLSIISTFSEDQISTRRAWGLWVCLTEMDKVKTGFKYAQHADLGSFMINTMAGRSTNFAEEAFDRKRKALWENQIAGSKEVQRKFCNMAHCGQWTKHICKECANQTEPEFGRGFGPRPDNRLSRSTEHEEHRIPPRRIPRVPKDARHQR